MGEEVVGMAGPATGIDRADCAGPDAQQWVMQLGYKRRLARMSSVTRRSSPTPNASRACRAGSRESLRRLERVCPNVLGVAVDAQAHRV